MGSKHISADMLAKICITLAWASSLPGVVLLVALLGLDKSWQVVREMFLYSLLHCDVKQRG